MKEPILMNRYIFQRVDEEGWANINYLQILDKLVVSMCFLLSLLR